jgi:hypothetical protein
MSLLMHRLLGADIWERYNISSFIMLPECSGVFSVNVQYSGIVYWLLFCVLLLLCYIFNSDEIFKVIRRLSIMRLPVVRPFLHFAGGVES